MLPRAINPTLSLAKLGRDFPAYQDRKEIGRHRTGWSAYTSPHAAPSGFGVRRKEGLLRKRALWFVPLERGMSHRDGAAKAVTAAVGESGETTGAKPQCQWEVQHAGNSNQNSVCSPASTDIIGEKGYLPTRQTPIPISANTLLCLKPASIYAITHFAFAEYSELWGERTQTGVDKHVFCSPCSW